MHLCLQNTSSLRISNMGEQMHEGGMYRLLVSRPGRQVNVVNLCLQNSSSLCKGNMGGVLGAEGEGLGEALGGRPEEAACAGVGVLWEGVYQLGNPLMELELQDKDQKTGSGNKASVGFVQGKLSKNK